MPIPYRDQHDLDELGTAAFLRLEADPDRSGYRGALFQVNARGEPVEFTYNRVATPGSFLWRPADLRRAALRRLTASLLDTCARVPRLLCCLASETPAELFGEDIRSAVPVCRIAGTPQAEAAEEVTVPGHDAPLYLDWQPHPPADDAPERRLARELARRGLLLEPFERAATGLAEVYAEAEAGTP